MNANMIINIGIILVFSGIFILLPMKRYLKKFGIVLLSLCLIAEVFVFNYHSYHLMFRDYEKETLSLENANVSTGTLENVNTTVITFPNLGKRIGTLYIDLNFDSVRSMENNKIVKEDTPYVNVKVDAKDETYAVSYRYGVANGTVIKGNHRSKTVVMNMSGEVSDLRITLSTDPHSGLFSFSLCFSACLSCSIRQP